MPSHRRFIDDTSNTQRVVIKFRRPDLLYCGLVELIDGSLQLPLQRGSKHIGPTILDMIERRTGTASEAPGQDDDDAPTHSNAKAKQGTGAGIIWCRRRWHQMLVSDHASELRQTHAPFKPGIASGGTALTMRGDWLEVSKLSTISISDVAVKLAVGMMGGLADAQKWIRDLAAEAWEKDLERALLLWQAIEAAGGAIAEDLHLSRLRPSSSVSEQVEYEVLRQACVWLGVDPDMQIKRPRGRPRPAGDLGQTEQGKYVAVTLLDGMLIAKLIAELQGLLAGTDLATLTVIKLAELLGALRTLDDAHYDADLVEAFLDASVPDWRDQLGGNSTMPSSDHDPYRILGVTRDTPMDDITRIYRATMQAIHPDLNHKVPSYFSELASVAYRQIKTEKQARTDPTE